MATPRRLTTPRRLFAPGTTKKYVQTGRSLTKRRRITRYTPRTPRSRRSVKDILQDLTQEKKKHERLQSYTSLHQMGTYLVGSEIYTGPASFQRIGSHITLTGIGIKGTFQWAGNSATSVPVGGPPATNSVWNNNIVVPVKLRIWLVSTKRELDPTSYWFQAQNQDNNINYNTGATADPTGDTARSRFRMNSQEIKVHMSKTYTVFPKRDIQQNFQSVVSINIYHKLKTPKVLKYNALSTQVTQHTTDQVQPNYFICYAFFQPDTGATPGQTLAQANMMFTTYYRE